LATERRESVRKYILEKGEVQLKELEVKYPNVSSMTLRRDLAYLENEGYIIRTRGGAIPVNRVAGNGEDIYSLRAKENIDEKMKVAKKAVELIETGRSIFIDSGTTMMCLAKLLPDDPLSIITSGPNIALEIIKLHKPSVVIVGGQLSRNTLSTSGITSLNFIRNINIDIAFMATSGFSLESGFTSGNFSECELKKSIIQKARKTIMLMDDRKIDKNMPFTFATLEDIDVLVCNTTLRDGIVRAAREAQVEIY
jgi:DeoR family fructose operon transcriptional repressor